MGKGKKKYKNTCLMQEWPDDNTCGIDPEDLIFPLKQILLEGYRLDRTAQNQFIYAGYNIGTEEHRVYHPTPAERFSSRWLNNETKFGRSLLDNILMTVFHLGIEQGRRFTQPELDINKMLTSIIELRTKRVHELETKLSEYGDADGITKEIPFESNLPDLNIDDDVSIV